MAKMLGITKMGAYSLAANKTWLLFISFPGWSDKAVSGSDVYKKPKSQRIDHAPAKARCCLFTK